MGCTWEKFSSLPAKNHKNLKPQPERKTFRQKRRVALLREKAPRYRVIYPCVFKRRYRSRSKVACPRLSVVGDGENQSALMSQLIHAEVVEL